MTGPMFAWTTQFVLTFAPFVPSTRFFEWKAARFIWLSEISTFVHIFHKEWHFSINRFGNAWKPQMGLETSWAKSFFLKHRIGVLKNLKRTCNEHVGQRRICIICLCMFIYLDIYIYVLYIYIYNIIIRHRCTYLEALWISRPYEGSFGMIAIPRCCRNAHGDGQIRPYV